MVAEAAGQKQQSQEDAEADGDGDFMSWNEIEVTGVAGPSGLQGALQLASRE